MHPGKPAQLNTLECLCDRTCWIKRPACDETVQFAGNSGSVVVAAVAAACSGS